MTFYGCWGKVFPHMRNVYKYNYEADIISIKFSRLKFVALFLDIKSFLGLFNNF